MLFYVSAVEQQTHVLCVRYDVFARLFRFDFLFYWFTDFFPPYSLS